MPRWVEHDGQRKLLVEGEWDPRKHARTRVGTFAEMLDAMDSAGELAKHEGTIEYHSATGRGGKHLYAPHCAEHGYLDAEGAPSSSPKFSALKQAKQVGAIHIRRSH